MTPGSDNAPVSCRLSSAELRDREATLIAEFKLGVSKIEELAGGYRFELPGDAKWLDLVAKLMAAERECCPFLRFTLQAGGNPGPLTLTMIGPEGTKEFLQSHFL